MPHDDFSEIPPNPATHWSWSKPFIVFLPTIKHPVRSSVKTVLAQSGEETWKEAGGKKRNFIETIELQIGLKNYDPQRDKRFVGGLCGFEDIAHT
jgi:hypothetical protein